jgi:hypothetical protein
MASGFNVATDFDAWRHMQRLENEVAGLWETLGHDHRCVASTAGCTFGMSLFETISISLAPNNLMASLAEEVGFPRCTGRKASLSIQLPRSPWAKSGKRRPRGCDCLIEREQVLENVLLSHFVYV